MARKGGIDWTAVRRDWDAGVLSRAAIAERHGLTPRHLRAVAKADGWAGHGQGRPHATSTLVAGSPPAPATRKASRKATGRPDVAGTFTNVGEAARGLLARAERLVALVDAVLWAPTPSAADTALRLLGGMSVAAALKSATDLTKQALDAEREEIAMRSPSSQTTAGWLPLAERVADLDAAQAAADAAMASLGPTMTTQADRRAQLADTDDGTQARAFVEPPPAGQAARDGTIHPQVPGGPQPSPHLPPSVSGIEAWLGID